MRAKNMNRHFRRQRGAILVMMAILVVVLIGIAALALDVGRLFVQRTELQNAADAAALAAAAELDGESDAQTRAKAAARQLLSADQANRGIYFGQFTPADDLPDSAFIFYSSLDPKTPSDGSNATPETSRFVEVTIDLTEAEEQAGEMVPLYFLPVLGLIPGVDTETEAGTVAIALAGVENVPCYEPAMFMCVDDKNSLPVDEGDMLWLRVHGGKTSAWTSGNFGFLLPSTSKTGAPDLQHYLANVGFEQCVSGAQYVSKTGQVAQKSKQGINSRFDIYESSVTPDDYPPAPNIINYPRDTGLVIAPDDDAFRTGNGNWNSTDYFNTYHSTVAVADRPAGWNVNGGISRWHTYLWELDVNEDDGSPDGSPHMPVDLSNWDTGQPYPYPSTNPACDPSATADSDPLSDCHGEADPDHFYCQTVEGVVDQACTDLYEDIYKGAIASIPYPTADTLPETKTTLPATHAFRRVMYVAALECETLGLNGSFDDGDVDVLKDGKILQFFLTEHATHPGGNPDKFEIFGEYIGPTEEGSGMTRRVIQLYE
jgi:hypothetical protein